jgi:hypothetical protein
MRVNMRANMKRMIVAAAVVVGLGTAGVANAQIVYGYSFPVNGGIETSGTSFSPFGAQTFTNFYSPFTGNIGQTSGVFGNAFGGGNFSRFYSPFTGTIAQVNGSFGTPFGSKTFSNFYSPFTGGVGQSFSSNIFGATNSTMYGFNPYTGFRSGTGFFQPNVYTAPFSGVNYGFLRRR